MDRCIAEGQEAAARGPMTGGRGLELLLPQDAFPRALWSISAQGVALNGRLKGLTPGFPYLT